VAVPAFALVVVTSRATGTPAASRRPGRASARRRRTCDIIVPAHPLTAKGLATPDQLVAAPVPENDEMVLDNGGGLRHLG